MTLENLLNALIQRGWKPFGLEAISLGKYNYHKLDKIGGGIEEHFDVEIKFINQETVVYSRRDIVSKESGLWQFVCENNLNYSEDDSIYDVWLKHYAEDDHESPYTYASCVWYLIESALKDESELEDFLLNSIKID